MLVIQYKFIYFLIINITYSLFILYFIVIFKTYLLVYVSLFFHCLKIQLFTLIRYFIFNNKLVFIAMNWKNSFNALIFSIFLVIYSDFIYE